MLKLSILNKYIYIYIIFITIRIKPFENKWELYFYIKTKMVILIVKLEEPC